MDKTKLIKKAIWRHEEINGEILSVIDIASHLWADRSKATQYSNYYNLINGKTRLNEDNIRGLCELFPHTDANYWMDMEKSY